MGNFPPGYSHGSRATHQIASRGIQTLSLQASEHVAQPRQMPDKELGSIGTTLVLCDIGLKLDERKLSGLIDYFCIPLHRHTSSNSEAKS